MKSPISRQRAGVLVDQVVVTRKVQAALVENGAENRCQRFIARATGLLVSATLNFALGRIVVTGPGGTDDFYEELGRLTALSVPVVTLRMMVMMSTTVWYIVCGVTSITGLLLRSVARGTHIWERLGG
jgi:hypothetical protein